MLTANTGFTVTFRTYGQLDQAGRDDIKLFDPDRGVIQAATAVLAALTQWEPTDDDENPLLRNQLMPAGFEFGKADTRSKMYMQLGFKTDFDWDLS